MTAKVSRDFLLGCGAFLNSCGSAGHDVAQVIGQIVQIDERVALASAACTADFQGDTACVDLAQQIAIIRQVRKYRSLTALNEGHGVANSLRS